MLDTQIARRQPDSKELSFETFPPQKFLKHTAQSLSKGRVVTVYRNNQDNTSTIHVPNFGPHSGCYNLFRVSSCEQFITELTSTLQRYSVNIQRLTTNAEKDSASPEGIIISKLFLQILQE